jgi:hypothetical protein
MTSLYISRWQVTLPVVKKVSSEDMVKNAGKTFVQGEK